MSEKLIFFSIFNEKESIEVLDGITKIVLHDKRALRILKNSAQFKTEIHSIDAAISIVKHCYLTSLLQLHNEIS